MFTNVDISTGAMYKDGTLLALCLAHLGQTDPRRLSPRHGLPDRMRISLQRFIQNIRVVTSHGKPPADGARRSPRTVKKLTKDGARDLVFQTDDGSMTVAAYFQVSRAPKYGDDQFKEICRGS